MRPELIIFDCDGVLIDSETVAARVVAAELTALGWAMTPEEALERFTGMAIHDMRPLVAARAGRDPGPGWSAAVAARLVAALREEAQTIPGAEAMLRGVGARGYEWRIASNSSEEEMAVKFARTGLTALVAGRCVSAARVVARGGRAKPAPDVFLAAAAETRAAPAACLVLEDSALGVRGAVAAGMVCYGFAPDGAGAALRAAGAAGIITRLDEIFEVLA